MRRVLISGAGIAGPALAYWLGRQGDECVLVERARSLRVGGQAVDFRGPVHRAVLERMEMWGPIHEHRTAPGDLVMLDGRGDRVAALPAVMMAGDVEIVRGDLCRLLYERTKDSTEYRFGDHVVALEDRGAGVDVELASGVKKTFDVVVAADGLHSGVRGFAFGDEAAFLRHHGYRIATFAMPDVLGIRRGSVMYSEPGRGVCIGAARDGEARALLVYRGEPMGADRRDVDAQKRTLAGAFAGMGWEVPRILEALDRAEDLYVDAIASVHVDTYARGRVVLLGDAAYGGTLGGQGTSLAIVGAYVLAGELAGARDPGEAFARYEERMRPYASRCQKGAGHAGAFFAPSTRPGLAMRNFFYGAMTKPVLSGFFEWLVKDAATDFTLPQYA
jgi:2-polyprenyl-6-methoxyphenol hydroxylase-like FAD-dependent oxidoreductase